MVRLLALLGAIPSLLCVVAAQGYTGAPPPVTSTVTVTTTTTQTETSFVTQTQNVQQTQTVVETVTSTSVATQTVISTVTSTAVVSQTAIETDTTTATVTQTVQQSQTETATVTTTCTETESTTQTSTQTDTIVTTVTSNVQQTAIHTETVTTTCTETASITQTATATATITRTAQRNETEIDTVTTTVSVTPARSTTTITLSVTPANLTQTTVQTITATITPGQVTQTTTKTQTAIVTPIQSTIIRTLTSIVTDTVPVTVSPPAAGPTSTQTFPTLTANHIPTLKATVYRWRQVIFPRTVAFVTVYVVGGQTSATTNFIPGYTPPPQARRREKRAVGDDSSSPNSAVVNGVNVLHPNQYFLVPPQIGYETYSPITYGNSTCCALGEQFVGTPVAGFTQPSNMDPVNPQDPEGKWSMLIPTATAFVGQQVKNLFPGQVLNPPPDNCAAPQCPFRADPDTTTQPDMQVTPTDSFSTNIDFTLSTSITLTAFPGDGVATTTLTETLSSLPTGLNQVESSIVEILPPPAGMASTEAVSLSVVSTLTSSMSGTTMTIPVLTPVPMPTTTTKKTTSAVTTSPITPFTGAAGWSRLVNVHVQGMAALILGGVIAVLIM